ncbi:hypothetical protein ACRRTK_013829 [Alexandromys fortis]
MIFRCERNRSEENIEREQQPWKGRETLWTASSDAYKRQDLTMAESNTYCRNAAESNTYCRNATHRVSLRSWK